MTALSNLVDRLGRFYVRVLSKPSLSSLNDLVLRWSIRARGYNNYVDARATGEAHLFDVILPKLKPSVCVDVGANVGSYSSSLLKALPDTTVYAFEPLQGPFADLMALKERFADRLVPLNCAVGERDERRMIYFDRERTSHASLHEEVRCLGFARHEMSHEIDVITLDSYFSNLPGYGNIDFIKIDTEGFEYEVLLGARQTIAECKPKMIQIEHNLHHMFTGKTLYLFAKLLPDYSVFQMLPDRLVRRDPADPFSNVFLFSNFLFARDDVVHLLQ